MSAEFNFEVTGLKDTIEKLESLGKRTDGLVDKGLKKGAVIVQTFAKLKCPVDSGELRRSIVVSKIDGGYDVNTNMEYAIYQEYGTGLRGDPSVDHVVSKRRRKRNSDGKLVQSDDGAEYPYQGIKPQPFMYPALEENKQQIIESVKQALEI
mgnify:CR=1 FL=1